MKLISIILFCFFVNNLSAQSISDSVEVDMNKFYSHNKKLTITKLYDIVSKNPESKREIKKATAYSITSGIIGGVGVLNIIYPLGMAFAGSELNLINLGVGAAIIGISIPFAIANKKHLKRAVKLYNSKLKTTSYSYPQIKINFALNTLQLKCTF